MEKAINNQIREELESAYLYLAMAAYFEDQDLPGFSAWMRNPIPGRTWPMPTSFSTYLFEREGRSLVPAIKEPQVEWKSPLDAFEAAYAHEQHITSCINDLVLLARKGRRYGQRHLPPVVRHRAG
jgi:ferritin